MLRNQLTNSAKRYAVGKAPQFIQTLAAGVEMNQQQQANDATVAYRQKQGFIKTLRAIQQVQYYRELYKPKVPVPPVKGFTPDPDALDFIELPNPNTGVKDDIVIKPDYKKATGLPGVKALITITIILGLIVWSIAATTPPTTPEARYQFTELWTLLTYGSLFITAGIVIALKIISSRIRNKEQQNINEQWNTEMSRFYADRAAAEESTTSDIDHYLNDIMTTVIDIAASSAYKAFATKAIQREHQRQADIYSSLNLTPQPPTEQDATHAVWQAFYNNGNPYITLGDPSQKNRNRNLYFRTATGMTDAQIVAMGNMLQSALGLIGISRNDRDPEKGAVTLRLIWEDVLKQTIPVAGFLKNHPVTGNSIPMAITEDERIWSFPTFNAFVVGQTGSGKGSAFQMLIQQERENIYNGTTVLYGIDPKAAEFADYQNSWLFRGLQLKGGRDLDSLVDILQVVLNEIDRRRAMGIRKHKVSVATPRTWLLIDEYTTLMSDAAVKKVIEPLLYEIAAQGRSFNVFLVAAGQQPQKENFGRLRPFFSNIMAGRLENATEAALLFSQAAVDNGCAPHEIEVASPANDYATAGIFYVKEEGLNPVRVRTPYTSDEDIDKLVEETTRFPLTLDAAYFSKHPTDKYEREEQEQYKEALTRLRNMEEDERLSTATMTDDAGELFILSNDTVTEISLTAVTNPATPNSIIGRIVDNQDDYAPEVVAAATEILYADR